MIRIDNSFCPIFKTAFVGIIIHLSACAQMLNEQSQDLQALERPAISITSAVGTAQIPAKRQELQLSLWSMGPCVPQGKYKGEKTDTTSRALWPNHQVYVKKATYSHWCSTCSTKGCVSSGPWRLVGLDFPGWSHGICDGSPMPMVFHPGPLNLA